MSRFVTAIRDTLYPLHQRWRRAVGRNRQAVGAALAIVAIVLIATVAAGAWFVSGLRDSLPDEAAIGRIGEMDQATTVYDDHDRLAFTIFKEQRIDVPLTAVSANLVRAITAIEDQRFYQHHGFDVIRMGSAALANLRHRRAVQGGSTITQQLARQSFLTPEKTIRRKLQELILAARIEQRYSKPRILELYLNKVYFGDGLYGVEAASRGYFGKHASDLTLSEAALLAGLVKSPSIYAPTIGLQRAIARRNKVLQAMLDAGQIDRATWQKARAAKVVLHDGLRADEPHGQYFKEQVRRDLIDRFGWQRVYQGGLRVFSTVDMPMQEAADAIVHEWLQTLDEKRKALAARRHAAPDPQALQAALIALEPVTGAVRAMVGGRDFNESSFNRAVQARRQPGSAFKPFVYAAALEAGYTPATILDHLDQPVVTLQGAWTPEDEHSSAPTMSLRTALRTSSNRAAVRLLQQIGIPRTVNYARALGIGEVPSVPSLALGSGEVTLASMTAAYAAFANRGLVPKPLLIRRVEDRDGRILYEAQPSTTRAISETTAFLMSTMMADVVNAGTAVRARRLGFTLPAAGKTGTTNDFNDAWFVGFTPKLATGVWVGFDQPHTILPRGFAAEIAVPVWAKFMKIATRGDRPEWFDPPSGIVTANVCRLSGKLATQGCQDVEVVGKDGEIAHLSLVYTEYFTRGSEPSEYCDLHPTSGVVGTLATLVGIREDKPTPPTVEVSGGPSSQPAIGSTGQAEASPAPKRKRGFWSRMLGLEKQQH